MMIMLLSDGMLKKFQSFLVLFCYFFSVTYKQNYGKGSLNCVVISTKLIVLKNSSKALLND